MTLAQGRSPAVIGDTGSAGWLSSFDMVTHQERRPS